MSVAGYKLAEARQLGVVGFEQPELRDGMGVATGAQNLLVHAHRRSECVGHRRRRIDSERIPLMLETRPTPTTASASVPPPDAIDELGPIDLLVIEFSDRKAPGVSLPPLIDLVERGFIRIFDLVIIRKALDGSVVRVDLADVDQHGQPALVNFEGASSGLLDQADIDQAAALIEPNSSAGLLLYEHRWEESLMSAIRRGGGQVVASERVPAEAVLTALDATESSQRSTAS